MSNLNAGIVTAFTLVVLLALTLHEHIEIRKTFGCSTEKP